MLIGLLCQIFKLKTLTVLYFRPVKRGKCTPIQTKPAVVIENVSQILEKKDVENVYRHVRAVRALTAMVDATTFWLVFLDLVHQIPLGKTSETHALNLRWRLLKDHAKLTAVEWSPTLQLLIACVKIVSRKISLFKWTMI